MGMNVGTPSAAGDPEVMIDINTTPLIDVMLVLLIMLIITIPIQLHSVDLNLPTGTPPPPPLIEPEVVRLNIEANGTILWNDQTLAGLAQLEQHLAGAAAQHETPELHIRPHADAQYQRVAAVMAAVQRHGLTKIGLVGAEQFL